MIPILKSGLTLVVLVMLVSSLSARQSGDHDMKQRVQLVTPGNTNPVKPIMPRNTPEPQVQQPVPVIAGAQVSASVKITLTQAPLSTIPQYGQDGLLLATYRVSRIVQQSAIRHQQRHFLLTLDELDIAYRIQQQEWVSENSLILWMNPDYAPLLSGLPDVSQVQVMVPTPSSTPESPAIGSPVEPLVPPGLDRPGTGN